MELTIDCGLPETHYAHLGVDISASPEQIRGAFHKLARMWHPDRHRGEGDAKKRFQEIQGAYEVLSDPQRRAQYDLGLLDLLDVEDYLSRFQDLILTPSGLGMMSGGMPSMFCDDRSFREPQPSQLLSAA